MSDIVRTAFGICGIVGGGAGLVAAFLVWRSGRAELAYLRKSSTCTNTREAI